MRDRSGDLRLCARRAFAAFAILIVALTGSLVPATTASSDPTPPAGMSTLASVAGTAQTNVPPSGPLTGLADGTAVTVTMTATGASAGNFDGAEARLCKGGATIVLQNAFNPTQGGNCLPPAGDTSISADTYGTTNDRDVIVISDPTKSSATIVFHVGTGSTSFQANSPSTVTCDDSNPCSLWIKEQFSTSLVTAGFQFLHYDLQFGSSSVTTTTTTLGATTTTTPAGTTTTSTLPSTTTSTSPTTTSTLPSTTTSTGVTSTVVSTTSTTVHQSNVDPTTLATAGGLPGVTGAPTTHLLWSAIGILIAGMLFVLVGSGYRRRGRRRGVR